MDHWQDHLEEAERYLDLAKARADAPHSASDCLYKAVVEIVYSINLLNGTLHPELAEKE